ncbi:MAG: hypothetical protein A2283_08575 [Lentisphaerae bacterium RIFOXYA12_FULL_48_11]|nr:MAG: hypothetical protein A2283_08575 [Lentisphaerae bacterium RIFOXYA12_FULL_48_11]
MWRGSLPREKSVADRIEREDLIRRAIISGDAGAFDMMWKEYGQMLFAMMLSMLCSHQDAEEVLQDVFVKIARNRDGIAGARNMSGYIYTIARNEALNFMKKRKKVQEPTDPAKLWLVPADEEESLGDESIRVAGLLAELPEDQRTVIVMKIYQNMTFDDIACAMGISLNTAASRYRYGMEKLKTLLGDLK